jgi:hypothetical protein
VDVDVDVDVEGFFFQGREEGRKGWRGYVLGLGDGIGWGFLF